MTTEISDKAVDSFLEQMAQRLTERMGQKHTQPTGNPTGNYMHGPGGIFGIAGLERDLISTRVHPQGLIGTLRAQGSITTNPLYPYLSGFAADWGADPDGVCDNCQTAGPTKSCLQTAQFGRYCRQTKEIELNRVGLRSNRGEFLDLRLVNDPLLSDMGGIMSMNIPGNPDLIREVLMGMVEVGVSFQNLLTPQVYQGNPANNSANGGYAEFPGLDILIGTNKVDAITGQVCPGLYSDIKDFNFGLVDNFAPDIVQYVTYMARYLKSNSIRQKFEPTEWVITMREELFYELTAVWPCSYLTYRCNTRPGAIAGELVDAGDAIAMRDNMRAGRYLLIDGAQWPVVVDDGIHEDNPADHAQILPGQFASDIYFIPLTVRGGLATTYMEYVDYSQGAMVGVADGRYGDDFWTDAGRFFWHKKPPLNWCVQWISKIEPRIILLTPQLAGRITNVRYAPLQHTREPFPGNPYFMDGGPSFRTGTQYYSDWHLRDQK